MKKTTQKTQLQILFICLLTYTPLAFSQIGIATNNPLYQLHMLNTGNVGNNTAMAVYQNDGTNAFSMGVLNTDASNTHGAFDGGITYTGTGFVSAVRGLSQGASGYGIGINGTANSSDGIGVFGSIPTTGSWLGYGGLFTGGLGYANGLYNLSDARAKKEVSKINNALEKIININGYQYKYDSSKHNSNASDSDKFHYGFMAQNVIKYLPHSVTQKNVYFSDDKRRDFYSETMESVIKKMNVVDYTSIIPITVEAIKEQQQIIETQKNKIDLLEKKLFELESKVNILLEKKD